jgi:hypothetical protein
MGQRLTSGATWNRSRQIAVVALSAVRDLIVNNHFHSYKSAVPIEDDRRSTALRYAWTHGLFERSSKTLWASSIEHAIPMKWRWVRWRPRSHASYCLSRLASTRNATDHRRRWKYVGSSKLMRVSLLAISFACAPAFGEEASMSESNSSLSSDCAARLSRFIAEIDQTIETSTSVEPLRKMIKQYFPLSGCNPEEAVSIARQSKYFDRADQFQKDVVIVLRRKTAGSWGFEVSFAISKETGESKLPTAMVDKIKRE